MSAATSASVRYEAARAMLARWDGLTLGNTTHQWGQSAHDLASALRAVIEPAQTNLTIPEIAENAMRKLQPPKLDSDGDWCYTPAQVVEMACALVGAGIQASWEDWEPADVPHTEFMLKNLGIEYVQECDQAGAPKSIFIPAQYIQREV